MINRMAKILIFFTLICINFYTNLSLAANPCNSTNFLYEVVGGEQDSKKNPSLKQLKKVKNNLIEVCNFFKPEKLKIPQELSILVAKKANTAFFHGLFNILFIPLQFQLQAGLTKHPVYSFPIAVHELGHAYFNSNIYSFTENRPYLSIQREWKNLSLFDLTKTRKQRFDYSDPFAGLTELFADCFAAIYFNNSKIIQSSLYFTGLDRTHKIAKQRSFLNRNFQHLIGRKIKNTDSHHQFDKARHHLWKYYLSNAKYQNKQRIIKTLLQVFEVFLHEKQNTPNFKETDMITANNLLISFVDVSFDMIYKSL